MARSLTTQSPTTSNTIPVVSNAGFNAGDLVYQKNGTVDVIPDGLVTTGSFDVSAPANIIIGATNSNVVGATGGSINGGSALGTPIAAKLSNGNIVYTFVTRDSKAYFRIADENNTDVVATTQIGSLSANNLDGTICVCALPAGGFAVAYTNASYQLILAIYTNTGSVTLSPTTDTTVGIQTMTIAARGSGQGFVIVMNDANTATTRYKVYSDAGAQTIAWTNVAAYSGVSQYCPGVAVRSDNSFVVGVRTGANIYRYYVYSSTGTAGVNGTINSTYITNVGSPHFSMTCMTTGTNADMIYFLFIEGSSNYIIRQTLSASNVLGTETIISDATTCEIQALSTGGYAVASTALTTGTLTLRIFNSSNTQTAITTIPGAALRNTGGYNSFPTVVEMTSNYVIAFSFSSTANVQNYNTVLAQVNKTTNLVRNFNQPNLTVSSVISGVNSYARSTSTPNGAYFLSNSTTTLSKTISSGSIANIQLASVGCNSVQAKGLLNGNVVAVYATSSAVIASVYTSSGTFVTSFTVASGLTSPYARLCVLANGKIVIAVAGANALTYYVYSGTTYALLTSANQYPTINASYIPSGTSNSAGFDMSAMTNNRFVVVFGNSGNNLTYSVITDTLTEVTSTTVTGTYYQSASVAATPNGGFVLSGKQGAGAIYFASFNATSSTTYSNTNGFTTDTSFINSSPFANQMATTAQGMVITPFFNGSGAGQVYVYDGSTTSSSVSLYTLPAGLCGVVGATTMPNGQVLSVYFNTNSSAYNWFLHNLNGQTQSNSSSGSFSLPYTPAGNPQVQVASVFDNVIAVTYLTSSTAYPILRLEAIASQTYTTNITAGVTPTSQPAYLPSQSNGYIFKGVATTSATAGGTGTVQNLGTAQLNSNYSASTAYQAFDSTGTLVQGTKGTIVGRNVNMTGNS